MAQQDQMPMTYADDEIDLMELVANLWDGKWLIAGITFAAMLLGTAYTILSPNTFTASYPLNPVSSSIGARYERLNAIEQDSALSITANKLQAAAQDEIKSRDPLVRAAKTVIKNHDGLPPGSQEFNDLVNSLAYGVELSSSDESDSTVIMKWTSSSKDRANKFLDLSLENTNRAVQKSLSNVFYDRLATYELQNKYQLEDLNTAIDEATFVYEMERDRRVAFLREQAAIARELGIAKNTIEAQTFATATSVLTNLNTDSPFYLRGYEAIDEELELIQSRSDPKPFVDGLVNLTQKRRNILNDRTVERTKEAFSLTPIATDDFTAIQTDVNLLTIESDQRPSLIIALAAIMGGMLGVFTVLIRKGLRNYRARQETTSE
jgi:LPS O-antigen subunit length determinant protein (WzzB/FepE family)